MAKHTVWPFYNIIHERVKSNDIAIQLFFYKPMMNIALLLDYSKTKYLNIFYSKWY